MIIEMKPSLLTQMSKPPSLILLSVVLFNLLVVPNSDARKLPVARSLTNTDGKKIDATVLANDGTKIKIRRTSDGQEFSIDLAKLTQEDQDFLNAPTVQEKFEPIPVERPPKDAKPEIRDWKLKDGRSVTGSLSSVNENQQCVFIRRSADQVTQILRFDLLTDQELTTAFLMRKSVTKKPSELRKFTLKNESVPGRVAHIDNKGIWLIRSNGSLIKDVKEEDLNEEDLEFIRAWRGAD